GYPDFLGKNKSMKKFIYITPWLAKTYIYLIFFNRTVVQYYSNSKECGYNQRFKRNLDTAGFNKKCRVSNFTIQATLRRIVFSCCTFFNGFLNSTFIVFGTIICPYSKSA